MEDDVISALSHLALHKGKLLPGLVFHKLQGGPALLLVQQLLQPRALGALLPTLGAEAVGLHTEPPAGLPRQPQRLWLRLLRCSVGPGRTGVRLAGAAGVRGGSESSEGPTGSGALRGVGGAAASVSASPLEEGSQILRFNLGRAEALLQRLELGLRARVAQAPELLTPRSRLCPSFGRCLLRGLLQPQGFREPQLEARRAAQAAALRPRARLWRTVAARGLVVAGLVQLLQLRGKGVGELLFRVGGPQAGEGGAAV
mmetsp:Transcript_24390/g.75956  ORF Transcript_24390/g.75956 Transcript_24390/m.75956 type:complete len:257 (+) Transcript_24390:397-1167(+)